MYELIQISEHDYYIDCPAKIGIVKISDTEVVIIDSGNDKDAGKKVLKHLDENGWTLKAIYNTHSHADHIGGNKLIQDRTGCNVYAAELENVYTNYPELEPMWLFGGLPFKDIQNKFLMAQPSVAEKLTTAVLPEGWKIIELPGHSFDMVGFITADGNAFIADSIASKYTVEKYGIGYLWNPEESLRTLESLKSLRANKFIPSHAEVSEDIQDIVDFNIETIHKVYDSILRICEKGTSFEEVLKALFEKHGMTMNAQSYALIGSTTRSYLSSLYTQGRLAIDYVDNKMIWKTND